MVDVVVACLGPICCGGCSYGLYVAVDVVMSCVMVEFYGILMYYYGPFFFGCRGLIICSKLLSLSVFMNYEYFAFDLTVLYLFIHI